MDNLNIKTRNGKRGNEIDSRLVNKIEECRFNIAKKASEFVANYENSSDTDEKNLIAYRMCALKCDVPEIMGFVRKFNQDLANQVEQVGIENRIAEVECSKNIKENADIGLNNVSEQVDIENHVVELDHPKNVKESADIGLNNAGDTNDKDAEKEKKIRNDAAKKLGDMLLKIDWTNIKFDEEVAKFEKLDLEDIRQAINSDKINGLNLIFLHYVLCKIYDNHATEQSKRLFLAKKLKNNISVVQKSLPVLEKFSKKALEIKSKRGFGSSDKTDDELKIIDKAQTLLKKVETTISNIDRINGYLLLIGRRVLENGEITVPDDCLGLRYELTCNPCYCQDPIKLLNLNAYDHRLRPSDDKTKNAISTVDKEIKSLEDNYNEHYKNYSKEHIKIVNYITRTNENLANN